MKTIVFALFITIAAGLSGCATQTASTERIVYRDVTAPRVVEPIQTAACPAGTTLTYWLDPKLGYTRPICVTAPTPTETSVVRESSGPGLGTWIAIGLFGAFLLHQHNNNSGYTCNYGRCW